MRSDAVLAAALQQGEHADGTKCNLLPEPPAALGKGHGQALAKAGATVVGTATSEKGAEAITKAIADAGAKGAGRVLDARDAAQCAKWFRRTAPWRFS